MNAAGKMKIPTALEDVISFPFADMTDTGARILTC
jgi:hypothetical protein